MPVSGALDRPQFELLATDVHSRVLKTLQRSFVVRAAMEGIGQIALTFAWPILSVLAAAAIVRRFLPGVRGDSVVIPLAFLFVTAVLTLSFVKPSCLGPKLYSRTILFELAVGLGVLMIVVVVAFRQAVGVPILVFALYVGAAAEELIFRLFLPNQLTRRLRSAQFPMVLARCFAFVLPQLAFASSHALLQEGSVFHITGREFLRLFTAGMLYSEIVVLAGLGVASGIHAALNLHLRLLNSAAYTLGAVSLPLLTFATLVLMALRLRRPDGITMRAVIEPTSSTAVP